MQIVCHKKIRKNWASQFSRLKHLDLVYGSQDPNLDGKYQCDLFYEILDKEERYPFLKVKLFMISSHNSDSSNY